ncbi:MAG: ABC transporter permease [Bacteroidales bacterium]|nr:ABC transporter permease [Bacteroidales bacterium]
MKMISKHRNDKRINIWLIIKREMGHKKYGFITGVLSLIIATAGVVGSIILLTGDKLATEQMLTEKEKELREEMIRLEDDYRKIMRDMGYNVLIVHREQGIAELESKGYATHYLDYGDVWKIAESDMKTLNHLLPVLQEKIHWETGNTDIFLTGIEGQVPVYSKPAHLTGDDEYRSPIMERVREGKADLGGEIAESLNLRRGDKINIKGETFEVNRIHPKKGTKDDLSVWIPLGRAQAILGRPDKINGILALQCVCHTEELGQLEEEVNGVLPHAKVFEFSSLIKARAEVREKAAALHEEVVSEELAHQRELRQKKENLASVLVILLIAGASVWIFVLIWNNVRERRYEIGILRAVGFRRFQILRIFLGKSVLMGIIGGIVGSLVGIWLGIMWSGIEFANIGSENLISFSIIMLGLLLAPVLALTAGFLPSVMAANRDPAVILHEQ